MSDAYVTEKRNNVIDYMKGIAIILMVLRHAGTPGTEIVEIFHMALFFMVSGWCFRIGIQQISRWQENSF